MQKLGSKLNCSSTNQAQPNFSKAAVLTQLFLFRLASTSVPCLLVPNRADYFFDMTVVSNIAYSPSAVTCITAPGFTAQ